MKERNEVVMEAATRIFCAIIEARAKEPALFQKDDIPCSVRAAKLLWNEINPDHEYREI